LETGYRSQIRTVNLLEAGDKGVLRNVAHQGEAQLFETLAHRVVRRLLELHEVKSGNRGCLGSRGGGARLRGGDVGQVPESEGIGLGAQGSRNQAHKSNAGR